VADVAVDTLPPLSPSHGGSPVTQRKKLALLPRSEHPQDLILTTTPTDESKSKSNPFGAERPVDTDSALKKVEEKLAREKEHKEDLASAKPAPASQPAPNSPVGPRHDKGRAHPKQLLRRTSATHPVPASGSGQSEIDPMAAKAEAQDDAVSDQREMTWRKSSNPQVVPPTEDEAGWETVPSRSKKVNGVGARH
jgi:hypothetical protein